jgi:uncharacterized protein (TIGR03546 family)
MRAVRTKRSSRVLARLLRPLMTLAMAILEEESARVLAASLTMGLVLGFVPKDNLIAAGLGVILLAWRFNLTLATTSAAFFSGIAAMLDPVADALGRSVLTHPSFAPTFAWLYELPLAPWTRFNNTVVMGSLLLALALASPMYLGALQLVLRYRTCTIEWMKRLGVDQLLRVTGSAGGNA